MCSKCAEIYKIKQDALAGYCFIEQATVLAEIAPDVKQLFKYIKDICGFKPNHILLLEEAFKDNQNALKVLNAYKLLK